MRYGATVINYWSARVTCEPAVMNDGPSVSAYDLSRTSDDPAVTAYGLTVMNYGLTSANYEPPVMKYDPAVTNYDPTRTRYWTAKKPVSG